MTYTLHTDTNVPPAGMDALMASLGWCNDHFFTPEVLAFHNSVTHYRAWVCDPAGKLVGYMSGINNGFSSVLIDTYAVSPTTDRATVGAMLVQEVRRQCQGYAIYAMPFADEDDLFRQNGFRVPGRPMSALSCRNDSAE